MKILILDNYDSFTYNLLHLVKELGEEDVTVVRNDQIVLSEVEQYDKIILSPDSGIPEEAGPLCGMPYSGTSEPHASGRRGARGLNSDKEVESNGSTVCNRATTQPNADSGQKGLLFDRIKALMLPRFRGQSSLGRTGLC